MFISQVLRQQLLAYQRSEITEHHIYTQYLATKSEDTDKHPLKASLYTGAAYIVTVLLTLMIVWLAIAMMKS